MSEDNHEMVVHSEAGLAETATAAQAAQATAMVQARFTLARRFRRNDDDVRTALKRECARPAFAAVARYSRPVGKKKEVNPETGEETGRWVDSFAEGPSIRFAEAATRHMGNIDCGSLSLHDDKDKRIVRVYAMDLESNASFQKDITVPKTVERRSLKKGQVPLGKRKNSYGEDVYIVRAEDSEHAVREAAEISKALRTLLLRLVPGWILDECERTIRETLENEDQRDPDAARLGIIDGFAKLGVKAADLAAFLGHDVTAFSSAELLELRAIGTTIRDGEATWTEVLAARNPAAVAQGSEKDPAAKRAAEVAEKVKGRVDKLRKGAGATAPEAEKGTVAPVATPAPSTATSQAGEPAKRAREPGEEG